MVMQREHRQTPKGVSFFFFLFFSFLFFSSQATYDAIDENLTSTAQHSQANHNTINGKHLLPGRHVPGAQHQQQL